MSEYLNIENSGEDEKIEIVILLQIKWYLANLSPVRNFKALELQKI